jgi:hypothetical protein
MTSRLPRPPHQSAVAGGARRPARVPGDGSTAPAAIHWRPQPEALGGHERGQGKIVGQPFPIGDRVDTNVYDPETRLVACSTGEGTIHVFHEDSPDELSVVETVKTEFGAKTVALDPKTHSLFVDTADFDPPCGGDRDRAPSTPPA